MRILFAVAVLAAAPVFAAPSADTLKEKLGAFTSQLNEAQQGQMRLDFANEAREGWNFFPQPHVGLGMEGLDEQQRAALADLWQYCLSESGYEKAEAIRMREEVLGGNYNTDLYYVSVFGDEKGDAPWMLRWEGHHLSLNWTIIKGEIVASSPQFMGANPTVILGGPRKGERTLTVEENLARELAKSLDAGQAKKGITSGTAPAEILTRMQTTAERQADEGLLFGELNPEQQKMLRGLVEEFVNAQNPALAQARLDMVNAQGWDTVRFVWMGGLNPGEGHYYRVQGPEFLIEYDNTQNNANHIHCVWRDFKGDFGRDILQKHYKQAHNTNPMQNWLN